jgi:serine/threonine protein kinase
METVFNSVGPYEIVGEIGRGGMATVFLATDTRTDRRVALKLVPAGTDREAREILDAEQCGAKLQERFCAQNRYVPEVYEHGTGGGYFYIAMEYLEGENLSDVIARGPVAPARAIDMTMQLCRFLELAHAFETTIDGRQLRSLVHGDLKPRNIRVLPGDQIKVLDFGIAKALSLSRKVTRNDFGTFAYLSPEWFDSGGNIDSHADLWAVGVLLYEMVAGVQPYVAPDTRRLELRIRSRRPPAPLGDRCPAGLQAVAAKLLAGALADRYADARSIREDLESLAVGRQTMAERQGWPRADGGAASHDEPPTRRTRPEVIPPLPVEEPTRRTPSNAARAGASAPPQAPPMTRPGDPSQSTGAAPMPVGRPRKPRHRLGTLRTLLLLAALAIVFNEYTVGVRARRLAASVPTRELDGMTSAWNQYDRLNAGSLHIGVLRLERALLRQSTLLSDRVIDNYRTPLPTVREPQWRMARDVLARAAAVAPNDPRVRASLRYCEGHLHRINGEARNARKQAIDAQHEFTDAVTAFREAAELRPNWPDPFLGLMRTFIYGLEDVDRGADALQQAERLGYTAGDRETVQLADGYRARGDALARTARTLEGMDQEEEHLTRAAEAYREAIERYTKAIGYAEAPRSLRLARRGLRQVEQRLSDLAASSAATPPAQPDTERPLASAFNSPVASAFRRTLTPELPWP